MSKALEQKRFPYLTVGASTAALSAAVATLCTQKLESRETELKTLQSSGEWDGEIGGQIMELRGAQEWTYWISGLAREVGGTVAVLTLIGVGLALLNQHLQSRKAAHA